MEISYSISKNDGFPSFFSVYRREASDALVAALEGYAGTDAEAKNIVSYVLENKDQLVKKSQ